MAHVGEIAGRGHAMNFARAAAGAAFLLLLSAELAAARPVAVISDVNLRAGPGTDAQIITLIPRGAVVEVGTCANSWCQVTFGSNMGYSIANNLGLGPIRRPAPGPVAVEDYPPPVVVYPPPAVVVGPPVYYGPYWRGGWGWRRRW
jgi:uncharacterized protein YraI